MVKEFNEMREDELMMCNGGIIPEAVLAAIAFVLGVKIAENLNS